MDGSSSIIDNFLGHDGILLKTADSNYSFEEGYIAGLAIDTEGLSYTTPIQNNHKGTMPLSLQYI